MTPLNDELIILANNEIKHLEKFKTLPKIIGLFGNNIYKLILNIEKAIKDNKPYNEYELLSDEEKKAFDSGELVF